VIPLQVSIQPGAAIDLIVANWLLTIGLMAVGLVAFWTFQERENDGSTIESVGERADDFFGNLLGGFGSLVFVTLTILTTIGAQLVNVSEGLVELAASGPALLLTQLAGILVGALGLSGVVSVPVAAWLIGGTVLTIIGLAVRRRRMRGETSG
jgi:hypothetical protein